MTILIGALFGLWVVALGSEIAMVDRLRQYRTDIDEGDPFWKGASTFAHRNAGSSENYTEEGQRRLGRVKTLGLVRLLLLAIVAMLFAWEFVL